MTEQHPISAALSLAQELEMDRARIAAAQDRICRNAGFAAVIAVQRSTLQALAERVRNEGGELYGWVP